MSDADPEAVTHSADGITVRKTVDTERFQTLAVVLELASAREDVARIQVVDRIPESIAMEDVGFHQDYGSEFWSVDAASVAFERDFEPGEEYTTIYGIRDYPAEEIDALLVEPAIELIETGPEGLDDVVDENRSAAVREFLSGEADLPGLGDDAAAAPAEEAPASTEPTTADSEPATAEEPAEPAEAPAPDAEPASAEAGIGPIDAEPGETAAVGDGESRREVRVPLTGGVVRVLIKELRESDVDPEDRRMLRDELLGTEGTTKARITHLQQRVSDLEAYSDALEAFIDEEGTAEEVISDLRDSVAELRRTVHRVDDRVDEVVDDLEALDDRTEAMVDDIEGTQSRVDLLADRVEDAEADITHVDERTDDLAGRIDRISTDLDGIDERVSAVDGRIDDLSDEVGSLRRDLRGDIEALEDDLADFDDFRERLSSVFGGGPGADASADEEN